MTTTGPGLEYFTLVEVAAILRCSKWTVYRLIRSGRLRAYQPFGPKGWWKVSRESLSEFMHDGGRQE